VARKGGRTYFAAACAEHAHDGSADWEIRPLPGISSTDIFAACPANCYAEIAPARQPAQAGDLRSFIWIGSASWPN
jgi:hypothetical protein